MAHLIDKDALVAEIERRLEELNPKQGEFMGRPLRSVNPKTFPRESELEKLLSFINTLEVKEVALVKENAIAAVELAREEMKESVIKMLDAEKENTGIGLCEYDAGHENGRMELIDALKNKLSEI